MQSSFFFEKKKNKERYHDSAGRKKKQTIRPYLQWETQPARHQTIKKYHPKIDLKIQRDKLQQYQQRITTVTDREIDIARICLAQNDRNRALLALRRKKFQESLLKKTYEQLAQIELLTHDVEFALIQKNIVYGLKQGTAVLKEIQKEMGGIAGVEKLLEDSEEAHAYQNEIAQMLSGRMSNDDEMEVISELGLLQAEITDRAQMYEASPEHQLNDAQSLSRPHSHSKPVLNQSSIHENRTLHTTEAAIEGIGFDRLNHEQERSGVLEKRSPRLEHDGDCSTLSESLPSLPSVPQTASTLVDTTKEQEVDLEPDRPTVVVLKNYPKTRNQMEDPMPA